MVARTRMVHANIRGFLKDWFMFSFDAVCQCVKCHHMEKAEQPNENKKEKSSSSTKSISSELNAQLNSDSHC